MKGFRGFVITLGVVLAVMIFSSGIPAFADADGSHGDPQTTAEQAASANDEATMESFVRHAKQHLDAAVSGGEGELSAFLREMRTKKEWNDGPGSVYLITLNRSGRVINHGIYTRSLFQDSLRNLPTVEKLFSLLEGAQGGGPVCYEYQHYMDGSPRWTCAVEYDTALQGSGKSILIGGFDHDENDQAIDRLECGEYTPAVTAEDVAASQFISESKSRETLKTFVKEAIKVGLPQGSSGGGGLQNAIAKIGCLGKEGTWKFGSIYLFIMRDRATGVPTVIVNGNNPEFTGSDFVDVLDEDGVDVGAEILKVAGENGAGDFVEYKWDNPLIKEDDLTIPGMSPGRSPKISYVEGISFPLLPDTVFIFGSGIYKPLEAEDSGTSDDDDGCAIAGTGSKPESTVFNLFLIVFSLCFAFWWKDRSKK